MLKAIALLEMKGKFFVPSIFNPALPGVKSRIGQKFHPFQDNNFSRGQSVIFIPRGIL